jgi:hypothetical protein
MSVRILRPENGSDLVNPLHIPSDTHLLGQLRALSQERFSLEVPDLEDGRSGFGSGPLKLGGMDLGEPYAVEVGTEEVRDGGLESEDGLVGGSLSSGSRGEARRETRIEARDKDQESIQALNRLDNMSHSP